MKSYQTMILATALDERDATTFRHAACLAQVLQARAVHVAHVVTPHDLPAGASVTSAELASLVEQEVQQRLGALIDAHRGLFPAGAALQAATLQGAMLAELVRLASQKSADLFCLGRSLPRHHHLLSDSAMRLTRKVPCSVLIVPPGVEPSYERILVAADFSDHSREALELAIAIARTVPGASITALHVYSVPLGWHKSEHSYEEFAEIMKGHAQRHWNEMMAGVDTHGVTVTPRFELNDHIPPAILTAADAMDASLIVVGSHGRTQPASILMGHVADTVCERATRPVLCVKRKGEVVNLLHAILQFFDLEND